MNFLLVETKGKEEEKVKEEEEEEQAGHRRKNMTFVEGKREIRKNAMAEAIEGKTAEVEEEEEQERIEWANGREEMKQKARQKKALP